MRKISKLLAISLVVVMFAAMFTACSSEEISLLKASLKAQTNSSMESKTDISIKMDVSDLPEDEMQNAAMIIQALNNMNISLKQKMVRDADTGSIKAEILSTYNIGGLSSYANVWLESSLKDNQTYIKEIIQMPSFATMALGSDVIGKDYIVLDTSTESAYNSAFKTPIYNNNSMGLNKQLNERTAQFYLDYAKNLKPEFSVVKFIGSTGANGKSLDTYQLKISDASLKDLLSYMVNDLGTNKENLQLIKDYIAAVMKISMSQSGEEISQDELDSMLEEFESGIPAFTEGFNEAMDTLKDVPILGKDGITFDYVIDNNGNIVGENGTIDLSLDLAKISEAIAKSNGYEYYPEETTGKINLKLTSKTEITKINENIDITFPVLTESNSVDYNKLMEKRFNQSFNTKNNKYSSIDDDEIIVFVNGKIVNFKNPPEVIENRTLVPAREVFEAMGGDLQWDEESQTATSIIGKNKVVFTIGSSEAIVNGESRKLDVPAALVNNRAYVPLRFLSDSVGGKLTWYEEASMAIIEM